MGLEILEEPVSALTEYGQVPIAYRVETRLRVEPVEGGLGGLRLVEERVKAPFVKDYDGDEPPERWLQMWDISNWGVFSALDGARRVGGAVVAWCTEGVNMLEGREDVAVLWDIRVHPDFRRRGIGRVLFRRASEWARERGCRQLKIETQNINVAACRFYAKQGCELGAIHRRAYAKYPHEAQLLWYLDLLPEAAESPAR